MYNYFRIVLANTALCTNMYLTVTQDTWMTYEWQRPSKSQHDYKKPTATTVLAHCVKITQNVAFEFFFNFPPIFAQLKLICLVTLFEPQACNVEWDFFCAFHTLCISSSRSSQHVNLWWSCQFSYIPSKKLWTYRTTQSILAANFFYVSPGFSFQCYSHSIGKSHKMSHWNFQAKYQWKKCLLSTCRFVFGEKIQINTARFTR